MNNTYKLAVFKHNSHIRPNRFPDWCQSQRGRKTELGLYHFLAKKRRMLQFEIISTYQDLESVEKGGRIGDASVLVGGGVVLRDVTVLSGAQEHLLDIQVEAGTEVLDGVHVDAPVDGITWGGGLMALFNNISTFKNLNCMALHAISVFGKV